MQKIYMKKYWKDEINEIQVEMGIFVFSFIKLQSIFLLKQKCLIKSVCFPSTSFFSLLGERNKSSRLEIPPFTQSFSGL